MYCNIWDIYLSSLTVCSIKKHIILSDSVSFGLNYYFHITGLISVAISFKNIGWKSCLDYLFLDISMFILHNCTRRLVRILKPESARLYWIFRDMIIRPSQLQRPESSRQQEIVCRFRLILWNFIIYSLDAWHRKLLYMKGWHESSAQVPWWATAFLIIVSLAYVRYSWVECDSVVVAKYKCIFTQYKNSHSWNKTVVCPSYLHNGIFHTW